MKPSFMSRFQDVRYLKTTNRSRVFVAFDPVLEKTVVVKIFLRKFLGTDASGLTKSVSWFTGIDHPHLLPILEAGKTFSKDFYYLREYLESSPEVFSENPAWVYALVGTVSFLYAKDHIHGAIEPSNLFIHRGSLR